MPGFAAAVGAVCMRAPLAAIGERSAATVTGLLEVSPRAAMPGAQPAMAMAGTAPVPVAIMPPAITTAGRRSGQTATGPLAAATMGAPMAARMSTRRLS